MNGWVDLCAFAWVVCVGVWVIRIRLEIPLIRFDGSLGADDEISAAEAKFEGLRMTAGSIPVTSREGETPRA